MFISCLLHFSCCSSAPCTSDSGTRTEGAAPLWDKLILWPMENSRWQISLKALSSDLTREYESYLLTFHWLKQVTCPSRSGMGNYTPSLGGMAVSVWKYLRPSTPSCSLDPQNFPGSWPSCPLSSFSIASVSHLMSFQPNCSVVFCFLQPQNPDYYVYVGPPLLSSTSIPCFVF